MKVKSLNWPSSLKKLLKIGEFFISRFLLYKLEIEISFKGIQHIFPVVTFICTTRLLIIRTLPYSEEEMVQIIKLRAATEGLTVDETAIQVLGQIGTRLVIGITGCTNQFRICFI